MKTPSLATINHLAMDEKALKPYQVTCGVTISLNALVYARDEKHAVELAEELSMPDLHENRRYREPGVSDEEWRTSGELDGEPADCEARELDNGEVMEDD